jgi:hypothetical protein
MTHQEIEFYLKELDFELEHRGVKGEICLYGGAVMCLVYNARPSTKEVDAIFEPIQILRVAVGAVADKYHLPEDWLNDSVKGFVVEHRQRILFQWPHLTVYVPEADYLLAMKVLAARVDSMDRKDIQFLIKAMNIQGAAEVFEILQEYYPKRQIKPATQFFIEELFEL